jgi:hypothetical protein
MRSRFGPRVIEAVIVSTVVCGAVFAAALLRAVKRSRFTREGAFLPRDVGLIASPWNAQLGVMTFASPVVSVVVRGGNTGGEEPWLASTTLAQLDGHAFHVAPRETASILMRPLGLTAIEIGNASFDATFAVSARGDADVVRAWFSTSAVQEAVRALHANETLTSVTLAKGGRMSAVVHRAPARPAPEEARAIALAVQALAAALLAHVHARALSAPDSPVRTAGVGGASGAPVGVSLGDRR